jgi:hypothetical protein
MDARHRGRAAADGVRAVRFAGGIKTHVRSSVVRQRPNTYECEGVRPRARELVGRLMDGFCGCCGRPSVALWCRNCEKHIGRTGKLCDRTYQALRGCPCPFQI